MARDNPQDGYLNEGFHSHGAIPIAGWFILEYPMKINDLGVGFHRGLSDRRMEALMGF